MEAAMKIGEARGIYSTQLKAYNEQKFKLAQQKKQLHLSNIQNRLSKKLLKNSYKNQKQPKKCWKKKLKKISLHKKMV